MQVEVTAQARLHFGFLDLTRGPGRRFGGIGLSISRPRVRLRIEPAGALQVEGEQAPRIEELARRFYTGSGLQPGARIRVLDAIPEHVGLGSGTQTSLALASGLARLHGVSRSADGLCLMMGRARRSGIGYHTFCRGGFVVDGGHPAGDDPQGPRRRPPLLAGHDFPEAWRILVLIPVLVRTISGRDEEQAFRRLPPEPEDAAGRMARIVLMRLLPALVEADLAAFGAALAEAQEIVGACFAAVQEGAFHPEAAGIAARLKEAGATGVGQSSWGPAIYAFARDEREEERLRAVAFAAAPDATLLSARGFNRGASVEVH